MDQGVDTICVEGRRPHEQLVDDDSQGPEVDSVVVRQLLHQLRRHVERRTLDRGQHDRIGRHRPREAEIAELHDSIGGYQYVLRFHVSVDDAMRMQIVKGVHQLLGDLAYLVLWEVPVVLQNLEELALSELRDHAELMRRLERVQQQNDVLVVEALQNVDLLPKIVQLFLSFASG